MLTYTPPESRPSAASREKPWLLLLLAFAWLWPGIFSRDLWNPAEPAVFTAVEAFADGGKTWLPEVLGKPYFEISPVYIWVSAWFQKLLSPHVADAYSASRFASVLFTVVGLVCCGKAGFRFLGRHQGRSVALILIGCAGLVTMAHFLGGYSVVFAALSMCLYGFALVQTRVIMASLLLGGGWALLFTSAGLLLPASLMLLALALPVSPLWRFKRYYLTLVGAFCFGLPLMLVYPFALLKTEAAVFQLWTSQYLFGAFGGIGHFQTAFSLPYFLKNLLWFAFPAWPLAVWTATRTKLASEKWGVLASAWLAVMLVLLTLNPHRNANHLIWLLPPLALLGAARLDSLRRGAVAFINWFGIMAFGLFAVFLWIGFFAMNYGWPAKLAERSQYFSPYYTPDIDIMPMVVAILFTPVWLWAITRRHIRGRQAVTNWAAGVTLVWALMMTLFLPWFDAAKSHAPVVRQMEAVLPAGLAQSVADGSQCIGVDGSAETARIVWRQYGKLPLQTDNSNCRFRLVQQPKGSAAPAGWSLIWEGARPRNKHEGFALLQKAE
ncbi:glycosyltransferase family 39 protein [Neisseria sp. Dent CA1/247]|uniref:ArnT family glycosyltransferase n=1 Tax=Neisseria sp. Dent CA1/247 TaxID=2912675 RepID=UPI001FD1F155|nr:glycosyltransferase family 39 protein [Neisseria sp. Dent CA1/247]UOO76722.1 glycosyltransferase family 39 protein [Neisseria sp. Dent CA1/247]